MTMPSRLFCCSFLFAVHLLLAVSHSCADNRLKAGIALPLTGLAAEYGQAYQRGIEMALAEASQERRERLALVFEDHQYDNSRAVSSVRKLLNVDKAQLIAVWGWGPSDAIAPISKELQIPLLLSSINPVSKGRPSVLNLASPLKHLLRPLAEHIIQSGYKRVAFLTTPVGALEQSAHDIRALLPSSVSTLVEQSVPPDANDFKTILTKMKGNPPDVVVAFLLPAQLKVFVEQARALDFPVPLVGENTFNDALVTALYRNVESGPAFVDWFIDPEFQKRLPEGGSHQVETAQGYFLGSALVAIANDLAGTLRPEGVFKLLGTMKPGAHEPAGEYKIVMDSSDFGPHVLFPAVLNQINRGGIRPYSS